MRKPARGIFFSLSLLSPLYPTPLSHLISSLSSLLSVVLTFTDIFTFSDTLTFFFYFQVSAEMLSKTNTKTKPTINLTLLLLLAPFYSITSLPLPFISCHLYLYLLFQASVEMLSRMNTKEKTEYKPLPLLVIP